jgi:hypothetical protein
MRSEKDVEAYLGRLNRRFSQVETPPGKTATTYLIHSSESFPPIALRVDPPLVLLRVHIGDVAKTSVEVFRALLQHNAKSLVHSSFGLEDERIVLCSALELENLDFNELEATLDEIDVALAEHVPSLVELMKSTGKKD